MSSPRALASAAARGIALRSWRWRPAPKREYAAVFENRTSDARLDNPGRMAAASVAERLQEIETVQVVPTATVFELAASGTRAGRGRDPVCALAEAMASGVVVSEAVYMQGPDAADPCPNHRRAGEQAALRGGAPALLVSPRA